MKKWFCMVLIMKLCVGTSASVSAPPQETVFLLHGMGRTSVSMCLLKHRLERAGYRVVSVSYPSTRGSVEEHVAWLAAQVRERCAGAPRVHFVTHSLGGVVLRCYLKAHAPANLGRVVMLAPPNAGSELADTLRGWRLYRLATGPSGQQLGTQPHSLPNRLGPVAFELGVIAGDVSLNPLSSWFVPGRGDGKVSVARARVDGMRDFLVVPHSHTFIMNSRAVARQTVRFLRTGAFARAPHDEAGASGVSCVEG